MLGQEGLFGGDVERVREILVEGAVDKCDFFHFLRAFQDSGNGGVGVEPEVVKNEVVVVFIWGVVHGGGAEDDLLDLVLGGPLDDLNHKFDVLDARSLLKVNLNFVEAKVLVQGQDFFHVGLIVQIDDFFLSPGEVGGHDEVELSLAELNLGRRLVVYPEKLI